MKKLENLFENRKFINKNEDKLIKNLENLKKELINLFFLKATNLLKKEEEENRLKKKKKTTKNEKCKKRKKERKLIKKFIKNKIKK